MSKKRVEKDRICPIFSIGTIIRQGDPYYHRCVKECALARYEGDKWRCFLTQYAEPVEDFEK